MFRDSLILLGLELTELIMSTLHHWFSLAWLKITAKLKHLSLQQELRWHALYNSLKVYKVQNSVELFFIDHIIPITNSIPVFIQHMTGTESQKDFWNTESDVDSTASDEKSLYLCL